MDMYLEGRSLTDGHVPGGRSLTDGHVPGGRSLTDRHVPGGAFIDRLTCTWRAFSTQHSKGHSTVVVTTWQLTRHNNVLVNRVG